MSESCWLKQRTSIETDIRETHDELFLKKKNALTFGQFPSVVLCWVHQFSAAVSCAFVLEGGGWSLLVQGPANMNAIKETAHTHWDSWTDTHTWTAVTGSRMDLLKNSLLDAQLFKRQNKCKLLVPACSHSFKVRFAFCNRCLRVIISNF